MKGEKYKFVKPNKAFHGLKQASRTWNKRNDKFLKHIGYSKCTNEHGMYVKWLNQDNLYIMCLYVDDTYDITQSQWYWESQIQHEHWIRYDWLMTPTLFYWPWICCNHKSLGDSPMKLHHLYIEEIKYVELEVNKHSFWTKIRTNLK